MNVELNDEVSTPRFEDTLWRELAQIHEAERRRPRRPGRRFVLAGAGWIAAAAVLVAGVVVSSSDDADAELRTRIVTATESALADSVVYEVTDWDFTAGPVDEELWSDETTGSFRMRHYADNGDLSLDIGPQAAEPGNPPVYAVDHCYREYTLDEEFTGIDRQPWTEIIAEGLARGEMYEDGTEVVDGRELIVLREHGTTYARWLIDPETYRPVRLIGEVDQGNESAYVVTFEFLPRTPENLASISTPIPGGFVEVDQLSRTDTYIGCN